MTPCTTRTAGFFPLFVPTDSLFFHFVHHLTLFVLRVSSDSCSFTCIFPYFESRQDQMKDGVWEEMDEAFTAVKKRRLELQTM